MKMTQELITRDEIARLMTNPRHLSWKDVVPGKGIFPPIEFTLLKSRYSVSYTIDSIFKDPNVKFEHVVIRATNFEPDPVDMDEIAHVILGDCLCPPVYWAQNGMHYLKMTGLNDKEEKQFIDEGIEIGVTQVGVRK